MNEEALKELYEEVSKSYEVGTLDNFKLYLLDNKKRIKKGQSYYTRMYPLCGNYINK